MCYYCNYCLVSTFNGSDIIVIRYYREKFSNILKANPEMPVKKLKGIRDNEIQFLQEYDKKMAEK